MTKRLILLTVLLAAAASAQFTTLTLAQKTVGTLATGSAQQGTSVAISNDGNTAVIGGPQDSTGVGAVWVFVRTAGTWAQQGAKLVGAGSSGASNIGTSVAISGDGNTIISGGPANNSNFGAAWVWFRTGTTWAAQGSTFLGTGGSVNGYVRRGMSVALSNDGNTAAIGAPNDTSGTGCVWIWTRSGSTWTQQQRIQGPASNNSFGASVSLSGAGNTLAVGVPWNGSSGVISVWTRSGVTWTNQQTSMVSDATSGANVGGSISLSNDGLTLMVGGTNDRQTYYGSVWSFLFTGGTTWVQQGNKIYPNDGATQPMFGSNVSLSSNGNIALICGSQDNMADGAVWLYKRSGAVWTKQGAKTAVVTTPSLFEFYCSGGAISSDGTTAVVGAYGDASGGNIGAVYFYNLTAPTFNTRRIILVN
jgi:hypothetical protein